MNPARWRSQNAAWLALRLEQLRLQMQRAAAERQVNPNLAWLVAQSDTCPERAATPADQQLAAVGRELTRLETDDPQFTPALRLVAQIIGLSELEQAIMLLAAAPALDGAFASACAELQTVAHQDCPTAQLALSLFVEREQRLIAADCLMPTRPLRRLRLIDMAEDPDEPVLLRRLGADERLIDYLRGVNHPDERLQPYLTALPPLVASEPAESAATQIAAIVEGQFESWPTVNLVAGTDGVALDAIQIACQTLGTEPCQLDITAFAHFESADRRLLTSLLAREALLASLAVVVDARAAADGTTAAAVEELIRTLAAPLFLVSAEQWATPAPDVQAVNVGRVTRVQQVTLWRRTLAEHAHSVNGEVDAIAQQFDFTPGAIADAVRRAASRSGGMITGVDLWDACRDQRGAGLDQLAHRIEPHFGWDDIVVTKTAREQLHELAAQVRNRTIVYENWGFATQFGRGRGITALFAGVSGTGKTMAAEILAGHLRLTLDRIDLAGVVSKYIGETEKNLRRVFDAAERSGTILMFDEADALFGTRTEVRDSHDRYANLEINYLLQRMEDYSGLAILATNKRSALDSAFLRRLRFIVDFAFPDAAERRQIWERVLPPGAERGELNYGQLARLEIAGGNIRSIAVNSAFLAASEDSPIEMSHLVRAAAREYAKLKRPLSAAEFGEWLSLVPA